MVGCWSKGTKPVMQDNEVLESNVIAWVTVNNTLLHLQNLLKK